MCVETMDAEPTAAAQPSARSRGTSGPRLSPRSASRIRWRMVRVRPAEPAAAALRMLRKTARSVAVRGCARRDPVALAKLGLLSACDAVAHAQAHSDVARAPRRCAGAMAPENTTQYIMANVYADMTSQPRLQEASCSREIPPAAVDVYGESLSPASVAAALDAIYDDYLAFQRRDFEEVFFGL